MVGKWKGLARARASWVLLAGLGLLATGCSDDSPRCSADRTLAQACAASGCPRDLKAALSAGRNCESRYMELWEDGDQRAIGVAGGLGGWLYHFDGDELVGLESWSDVLDDDCPIYYVNGRTTVSVSAQLFGADVPPLEPCVLCPDWATDDDHPLCP